MELPVYRTPRWKPILRMTWARGSVLPETRGRSDHDGLGHPVDAFEFRVHASNDRCAGNDGNIICRAARSARWSRVLQPMGVDWRVGVGLISAFAAREVFVSSMAIVFHVDSDNDQTAQEGLLDQMRTATFPGTSQRIFTPSSIFGLIVFFFFSLQCFSTVAVVRRETNSWRTAGLQLAFYTGLGYLLAVTSVQTLRALGVA